MWEHNGDKYLTRKEAAEFLGIKVCTLNLWAKKSHKNYIPFMMVGKGTMYNVNDLEKFLEGKMGK